LSDTFANRIDNAGESRSQVPPCFPPRWHHNDRVSTQHRTKGAIGEHFRCHRPQPLKKFEEFLIADASYVHPSVLAACHDRGPDAKWSPPPPDPLRVFVVRRSGSNVA
jgi:hypothetical protein